MCPFMQAIHLGWWFHLMMQVVISYLHAYDHPMHIQSPYVSDIPSSNESYMDNLGGYAVILFARHLGRRWLHILHSLLLVGQV